MSEHLQKEVVAIIENIKRLRTAKRYSQEYMAHRLATSQNTYSKIELQLTRLSIGRLLLIAEILEVDPAELINFHKENGTSDLEEDLV